MRSHTTYNQLLMNIMVEQAQYIYNRQSRAHQPIPLLPGKKNGPLSKTQQSPLGAEQYSSKCHST